MIIAKHFEFEASHQLPPEEECYGACRNLHGHRYELTIEIAGKITDKGWVINFKDLKKIVNEKVINKLDHTHLNDSLSMPIPTAENIVKWIAVEIHDDIAALDCFLYSLTLYETSNSYAKMQFIAPVTALT